MSTENFPTLPGLAMAVTRRPEFRTLVKESASGREYRAALRPMPRWRYTIQFEVLRAGAEAELQALVDFFVARQGAFDSFLFTPPGEASALLVRFVLDYQDFERFAAELWSARKVELISLL